MSKEFILEKLRSQFFHDTSFEQRQLEAKRWIRCHSRGVLPSIPRTQINRRELFISKAQASQASVETVTLKGVATAITRWLDNLDLPAEIRMGEDPRLTEIMQNAQNKISISIGASEGDDLVGLSHAECGVVETGTLALLSGKENPTTLNFLPENHIVILQQDDLVDHYEDIWDRIRIRYGRSKMPRTVNMITGPSRSADIEQTLILGAHGPLRLHILLLRG